MADPQLVTSVQTLVSEHPPGPDASVLFVFTDEDFRLLADGKASPCWPEGSEEARLLRRNADLIRLIPQSMVGPEQGRH